MRNFKLTLCYDGGRYDGWQRQGNSDDTIQGRLETLLSRLLDQTIEVAGSGRTDAGVHALAQVCSFRAETEEDCEEMLAKIRQYLPEDIGAISLEEAPPRFHARLSCREKTYVYRIWNSAEPNVFERKWMLAVPRELDPESMRRAAAALVGEHDFSAFCANRHMKKTAVRRLKSIEITRMGGEIRIALTADGFLYHMVRIIVGTLLEVGEGKRAAEDMAAVLASRDRMEAGPTAPAQGLTLWDVKY
ncbi:MAG: tRNA pseudouridine(38-40) synthase TruA [Oscillospiraceae bacterium]|nr:tRNA pseudouridine(38-40) synthase TruA [Oscillospiraceae bacterium]